jgi:hypothetical protein
VGAGNTVDGGIARITHAAVRRLHLGQRNFAGIDHMDAHRRHPVLRGDQPAFDCSGADTGKDIAAALLARDERLIDEDLQKEIVHVRIVAGRGRNDRDLGRERIGPTDAVDLSRIG